jgi:uncharacterized protein YciI
MPYFIETFDRPNHGHVRQACGAKLTDDGEAALGGVYLVDVETRAEAERFIAEDPFTKADLFLRIEITRWRKAYLDGRNYL